MKKSSAMTIVIGLSALALAGFLALFLSGCSQSTIASPKALAAKTKEAVEGLKDQEKSIFQIIERNLSNLRELLGRIKETSYDEALKELRKITESFEALAKDKDRIEQEILSAHRSLKELAERAQEELSRLRRRKAELERELAAFQHPNPNIVEIKRKNLSQTIKYLSKQIEIWEKFLKTQKAIEVEALKIDERIEEFLIIVDSNATLYREALNLLELQRDIKEASALLSQIPEIERLAKEMVSHWDILDSLVEDLLSLGG